MKFNTKIRYGLRTMIELAKEANSAGVLQKEIAKNQSISVKYLDYIIAALKDSGLIRNVKGKKSGYKLTRNPEDISTAEIFSVFDKELTESHCQTKDKLCDRFYICATRVFWKDLNSTIVNYLTNVNLKDLARDQSNLDDNQEKTYDYHI